jgi:hypothetical protein
MSTGEQERNFIEPELLFSHTGLGASAMRPPSRAPVEMEPADARELPRITRLPDGIEVIEQRVGRAIGNWILQVRCQCGRRWFELNPVDATHCPRCGMYVYIDVAPGGGPKA